MTNDDKSLLLKVSNCLILSLILGASITDLGRGATLIDEKKNVSKYVTVLSGMERLADLQKNQTFLDCEDKVIEALEHTVEEEGSVSQQMVVDYAGTLIEAGMGSFLLFLLGCLLFWGNAADIQTTPFFLVAFVW